MTVLVVLMLALSACGATPTATPVPPTATPVPPTATAKPALSVATVIDIYLTNLPAGFGGVAPAALNDQIAAAKPFILDTRETCEVASAGTIAGAVNIPIRELAKNLNKLPAKDQPIVVICGSGHRSAIGMVALQVLGYTNVKSMTSGMAACGQGITHHRLLRHRSPRRHWHDGPADARLHQCQEPGRRPPRMDRC